MNTGITSVKFCKWNGASPAMVNRMTGQLYINYPVWSQLPPEQRFFVLLHEAGHATLKTKSEDAADEFAFKVWADRGYPLSEAVFALTRVLSFSTPEHHQRAVNQLNRAFEYDRKNNDAMTNTVDSIMNQEGILDANGYASDFLGLGKKARERRKEKKEDKQAHQLAKIAARGDARAKVAGEGGGVGNFLKDTLGNIFGKKTQTDPGAGGGSGDDTTDDQPTGMSKGTKTAIIVVVVILIIVAIWYFSKKK